MAVGTQHMEQGEGGDDCVGGASGEVMDRDQWLTQI